MEERTERQRRTRGRWMSSGGERDERRDTVQSVGSMKTVRREILEGQRGLDQVH